ncbi:hypothetical protein DYB25_006034 [Aphanomyces astaci]|uniref:Uncharacterized protein n=1 Tax=Aphanomyces astaci TaxID=112090 RepID=A0A397BVI6_APHAT|nr:hypothetical protein DYB25_006034 [Aphanomyces astaci]
MPPSHIAIMVMMLATMAAVSPAIPFCSNAQVSDAIHQITRMFTSEYVDLCAADVGYYWSPDAVTSSWVTSTQLGLAKDSANCQWLFREFQAAVANESCIELTLATSATFELFLSYINAKTSYPPATLCNVSQVQTVVTQVALQPTYFTCLAAAGLNASTAFRRLPSPRQLHALRVNGQCAGALWSDLQRGLSKLPTCALFQEGTPVQAIAHLSIDLALSWLEFLATSYHDGWTHQNTSRNAIEFPRNPTQHGAGVILGAMLVGTGVVFAVYVVYSNHREPAIVVPVEEELRLLAVQVFH